MHRTETKKDLVQNVSSAEDEKPTLGVTAIGKGHFEN